MKKEVPCVSKPYAANIVTVFALGVLIPLTGNLAYYLLKQQDPISTATGVLLTLGTIAEFGILCHQAYKGLSFAFSNCLAYKTNDTLPIQSPTKDTFLLRTVDIVPNERSNLLLNSTYTPISNLESQSRCNIL